MKFIENWGNGKIDISDMAVIVIFLMSIASVFSGSVSLKKKAPRKKA